MIDTHCHLVDGAFDADRETVVEKAFSDGISALIEISCEPSGWKKSLELCGKYENIFCAVGVHPNDADKFVEFSDFLTNEKVVAVGECGLDYYRSRVDKKIQISVFEKQLEIAEKFKKPVVVHCRQADKDVLDVLRRYKNAAGVIHCFSSTVEFAEKFLQLGFYIGIDGPATYPNAKVLREVIKMLPLEKILLETDSPYLPPQNFRGKRNEPSYVKFIAEKTAEIKNMEVSEISKITDENAKKLFGI